MDDEMTDQDFARAVVLGAVVGIVVTFVVMVVGLMIFTGIGSAVPAMAWAAIVGGGFFGATVTVGLAIDRTEKAKKANRAARHAASTRTDKAA
jgi:flagellar motor component MotA